RQLRPFTNTFAVRHLRPFPLPLPPRIAAASGNQ
ncbi:hypothetical protein NPIL_294811, partial [Nephila pilipes]